MSQIVRDIEKYTKDYNNSDFEHVLVTYRRKKVLEILNSYKPKNIIEVGCGNDSIFNHYKDYDSFTVVEPSLEFCNVARQSLNYNDKITLINGFLEDTFTKCIGNDYDFIIVSGLLHEVPNPDLLLSTVKKLCTSKTVIHVNVPNSKSFHLLWAFKAGLIPNTEIKTKLAEKLQRNTIFDMEKLVKTVENNGFTILEKGSYFIKPFNHEKMQQLIENNYIDNNLLNGLYDLIEYLPEFGAEIFVNLRKVD